MGEEGEEVAAWLASLPTAPVFRPSEEEFVDPIAYILKIEKQASQYGICKIIPPLSRAPEETVLSNLNHSLSGIQEAAAATAGTAHGSATLARSMCAAVAPAPVAPPPPPSPPASGAARFTTRRQQLGWSPRRPRGGSQYRAQKLVWESGEYYTLEQFQEKARSFSSAVLGRAEEEAGSDPLVVESLFWNAELDRPISVEYANDIPGSAFLLAPSKTGEGAGEKLASSGWNIRNIARSHGSLLRFMPDEVPGVTTPMVYLGMLFSWFAWHVEDHELHSLNYLHSGARKTWYAVPSDAALALEEVIRLYGYASRLSPRAAFTLLGEKTTILSPEVLVAAGVPCCRLVQNPGEYVITFPRAYHLGFSHGFNCGEAANFATPAWLDTARQAAARRATMNHLPMLSHEQLLYLFSMSLLKRAPTAAEEPSVVEEAVKAAFLAELKENNLLMSKLLAFGAEGCVQLKDPFKPAPAAEPVGKAAGEPPPPPLAVPPTPEDSSAELVCVESRAFSPEQYDCSAKDVQVAPFPTPWGALPCSSCGILCFASMALVQPSTPLPVKQRKYRARVAQAAKPLDSGVCLFNSASDEAVEAPHLPEDVTPVAVADTTMLEEPPGVTPIEQMPTSAAEVLNVLSEAASEAQSPEPRACPGGAIKSSDMDAVGISVDAPWLVIGSDLDDEHAAHKDEDTTYLPPAEDQPFRKCVFVSSGLCFGDASDDAPPETGAGEPLCSFNSESNNVLSTSDQDEQEMEEEVEVEEEEEAVELQGNEEEEEEEEEEQQQEVAAAAADTPKDEPVVTHAVFQLCASNEGPTLEDDATRSGPWNLVPKGSSRPYVFCPQHAVQAVTSLQPHGGATVLAICHSNLEVIQKAAEGMVSEEMNTWKAIPLREASSDEVDVINKAIHLKGDATPGLNWTARLGVGSQTCHKLKRVHQTAPSEETEVIVGSWCGKEWKAKELHPLLGGTKVNSQAAFQIVRRSQTGKFHKRFHGLVNFALLDKTSKMRRESWEGQVQDRIMTAAILRKSKRNAVMKTAREQAEERRKKLKHEGARTVRQLGLCKQAMSPLECGSPGDHQLIEGGMNTPQRLTWHDVPVACSPAVRGPEWSNDEASPTTAICSTSHQDTALEEHEEKVPSETAVRLKRRIANHLQAQRKKLRKSICVDNTNANDEANASTMAAKNTTCNEEEESPGSDDDDESTPSGSGSGSGSSSDEYSLKAGEVESESEGAPKALPCFTSSKKRSCSRVKRATWDNLLNRLPPAQQSKPELQNQDSCPLSCVTESGWTYGDDDLNRPKARSKSSKIPPQAAAAAAAAEEPVKGKQKKAGGARKSCKVQDEVNNPFPCDIEGCIMSFCTEQELVQHKKNKCTYKGCGKKFFSHKYLVQHRRVHMDDRPLKCPWQGCSMSFKWAWARTEHIRVHTGERPYACPDCDKTFRFVSDFSRHKRNTGHARG